VTGEFKHPISGETVEPDQPLYCVHCERTYPAREWVANDWDCPWSDCDGGPLDCWPVESDEVGE
jgi:hypothetical protein